MNLNITKELYIFISLLIIAIAMVGVYYFAKLLSKKQSKVVVALIDFAVGVGFCLAVFGVVYWLDDGVIRAVYPLLAVTEFFIIVKIVEKIKVAITKRRKKVVDTKSNDDIK